MRSVGQSDGRRWCASFRDLDLHFWHGIFGFPPWYLAANSLFATKRTQRVVKYGVCTMFYVRLYWGTHVWNLLVGHLPAFRQATATSKYVTKWRKYQKAGLENPLRWTIFLNLPWHKAMQYHMFSLDWTLLCWWNTLLWLTSQDGYGRLPDLNLPEKLFWEQPEQRMGWLMGALENTMKVGNGYPGIAWNSKVSLSWPCAIECNRCPEESGDWLSMPGFGNVKELECISILGTEYAVGFISGKEWDGYFNTN